MSLKHFQANQSTNYQFTLLVVYEHTSFEDADTKKFVPLTKFCDIQGMLELFEDKAEEIGSGKNKYFTMLEVVRKLKGLLIQRNNQQH